MAVISILSTDAGSAEHSSRLLEPLLRWIKPNATPEEFALVHGWARKAAHLLEYAVLSLLTYRAIRLSRTPGGRSQSTWRAGLLAFVIAGVYSASDELHQSYVPGRTGAVGDVVIDCCGAALGLSLVGLKNLTRRGPGGKAAASTTARRI